MRGYEWHLGRSNAPESGPCVVQAEAGLLLELLDLKLLVDGRLAGLDVGELF